MTLFPSVDGHPENITVINPCSKIHSHFFFDNVKVSMFETRELFEYAKKRVRRYVDT